MIVPALMTMLSITDNYAQERIELNIIQRPGLVAIVDNTQHHLENVRQERLEGTDRSILGIGVDFVANFAARALTSVIDNAHAKRTAEWTVPTTRDFFYNDISYLGPLDPSGMQFSGFSVRRDVYDEEQGKDCTALYFKCSLQDSLMSDFISNSRFTLQLDTLAIDLSKLKAKFTSRKRVSVEITIKMFSTWLDRNLTVHKDQQLGEFRIGLSNLKYDKSDSSLRTFGKDTAKNFMSGYCFFIPRSYGAYTSNGEYKECWGEGEFDIEISVRECTATRAKSKNSEFMMEYVQSALPAAIKDISLNTEVVGPKTVKIISTY